MAVTYSGKKLDAVTTELASEVTDNRRGFFGRNMAGGEILHESFIAGAAERHKITAKRDVLRPERHPHASGFERRAAGMIERWVVAHDAHVADVAARRKTGGDHMRDAVDAVLRKPIHVGRARRFQWRLAAEYVERIIRHAVALKNDIFHLSNSALMACASLPDRKPHRLHQDIISIANRIQSPAHLTQGGALQSHDERQNLVVFLLEPITLLQALDLFFDMAKLPNF